MEVIAQYYVLRFIESGATWMMISSFKHLTLPI